MKYQQGFDLHSRVCLPVSLTRFLVGAQVQSLQYFKPFHFYQKHVPQKNLRGKIDSELAKEKELKTSKRKSAATPASKPPFVHKETMQWVKFGDKV